MGGRRPVSPPGFLAPPRGTVRPALYAPGLPIGGSGQRRAQAPPTGERGWQASLVPEGQRRAAGVEWAASWLFQNEDCDPEACGGHIASGERGEVSGVETQVHGPRRRVRALRCPCPRATWPRAFAGPGTSCRLRRRARPPGGGVGPRWALVGRDRTPARSGPLRRQRN